MQTNLQKLISSTTLYQQIKAISKANGHLLVAYKNDLATDRSMLRTVKPGDQWVWVLRECGTNLLACPLTYAAQLLREGVSEYDPKITAALKTNSDWINAIVDEHMRCARNVRAKAFHLVCNSDGEQTVEEISVGTVNDLMRWSRWQAFKDWRESVLAIASSISYENSEVPERDDWWNTAAIDWTALDWLEHYRAGNSLEAKANPKVYAKKIAAFVIEAMKLAAIP